MISAPVHSSILTLYRQLNPIYPPTLPISRHEQESERSPPCSRDQYRTWLTSAQFDLTGRVALVTGGARGCGLSFAEGLAEAGCSVAIFDIIPPSPSFHSLSSQYGVRTASYTVDVSSSTSLADGFKRFAEDFSGALDICVPCAGVNANVSFLETVADGDFARLMDVNVKGVYFTAQLAAKQMISNGTKKGSIVCVASIASHMAIRSQMSSAYCATKGAVRAMVPAIAAELVGYVRLSPQFRNPHLPHEVLTGVQEKQGIRVNSLSPGYVRTEMTAPFPHLLESWKDEIMNGRVAEPDDIRGACVFLASDASAYMTGQDLLVDGGVTRW